MSVMTALKAIAIIAISAFLVAFAYISYRNALTPRTIDLTTIGTSAQVNVNSSAICQASWSDFNTAGTAILYVDQNVYRMDVSYVNQGNKVSFHVAGDSQSVSAWSDSGATMHAADIVLPDIPALHQAPCKTWWNADPSSLKPSTFANLISGS